MNLKKPCLPFVFVVLVAMLATGCDSKPGPGANAPAETSTLQQAAPDTRPATETDLPTSNSGGEQQSGSAPLPTISSASSDDGYQELTWDDLIPPEYQPGTILAKYQEQLESLDDADPKAMELYGMIQAELDNAPVNDSINGKKVKLPGFIAPLENDNGKVSEFLLVPYFGACIHVPPPPVNQTVMIKTRPGSGIAAEDTVLPFWVKGVITTDGESTDIGAAGYRIEQAETQVFEE